MATLLVISSCTNPDDGPVKKLLDTPGDLAVVRNSETAVALIWDDNSREEDYYVIERSVDGAATEVIDSAAANSVRYVDTDLETNRTYSYRIKAVSADGESEYSNTANIYLILYPPTQVMIFRDTETTAQVSWSDISQHELAYYVERAVGDGEFTEIAVFPANTISFCDSNLTQSQFYRYRIKGRDERGDSDFSTISKLPILHPGMLLIPGGDFLMGNIWDIQKPSGGYLQDQYPVHEVTLSSFYMARYEMTEGEYNSITGNNDNTNEDSYPIRLSWFDAVEFCNSLSAAEGRDCCYTIHYYESDLPLVLCDFSKNGYRLPTEAEWEYAASYDSSGTKMKYAGTNNFAEISEFRWSTGLHPVGLKQPNQLGLYDMGGNAWEMCWDFYNEVYPSEHQINPTGPASSRYKVVRDYPISDYSIYCEPNCKTSCRLYFYPPGGFGFRIVCNKY